MIKQINRKVISSISITALLLLTALAIAVPVNAATPAWDIKGTWNLDFTLGGGHYLHTMTITSFDASLGDFSGTGSYNPSLDYTWTVTGNVQCNEITFHILYTGTNHGYYSDAVGLISSDGASMSGTWTDSGSNSGTWTAAGTAVVPSGLPFGSFVNSGCVPTDSKLVLNINYKVTNDEDSGMVGYWALDSYNKQVHVWQAPDNTFYAVARYAGQWQTFTGALSPQAGTAESKDASGTFQGGYIATFTGTLNPTPIYSTFGNIGTFNFGGTISDILLKTYSAGQTGPITPFSYLSTYFSGVSGFTENQWGWVYHYRSQAWNNFAAGSSGDIVV